MWLQHKDEKPVWFPVRDKVKASEVLKRGQVTIKGVDYKVVGLGDEKDLTKVIDVFYNPNKEVWENYQKLKEKVKQFKKTGVWLHE